MYIKSIELKHYSKLFYYFSIFKSQLFFNFQYLRKKNIVLRCCHCIIGISSRLLFTRLVSREFDGKTEKAAAASVCESIRLLSKILFVTSVTGP